MRVGGEAGRSQTSSSRKGFFSEEEVRASGAILLWRQLRYHKIVKPPPFFCASKTAAGSTHALPQLSGGFAIVFIVDDDVKILHVNPSDPILVVISNIFPA